MELLGFLLASLSAVLFGLYMVPRKLTRLWDCEFVLSMAIGVQLATVLVWGMMRAMAPPPDAPSLSHLYAFLCGPLWAMGILSYTFSITHMGLALSTPIKNTTAVIGTLIGIVFFAEWTTTAPIPCLIGSALIVVCAIVLGMAGDTSGNRSQVTPAGVAWAIAAAIFFASYTIPMKLATGLNLDVHTLMLWMASGILITQIALFRWLRRPLTTWLRYPFRDHFMAALAGWLWYGGILAMIGGIERIGLAVTWPISNLNTIVTVLIGIVAFHEVDTGQHRNKIAAGLFIGAIGVILLGLSKG